MSRRTFGAAVVIAVLVALIVFFWPTPPGDQDLDSHAVDPGTARNTPNADWLQGFAVGELENLTVTDPPVPLTDIPFRDGEGRPVHFADYAGKVLVVNFWATWCAPCKVEMPALDRLARALGGDDFAVLTISIDREGAAVAGPFLDEIGATALPLYVDPGSAVTRAMGVRGLPVTLVVDRTGHEVARYVGPAEWDAAEAEALIRALMDHDPA